MGPMAMRLVLKGTGRLHPQGRDKIILFIYLFILKNILFIYLRQRE